MEDEPGVDVFGLVVVEGVDPRAIEQLQHNSRAGGDPSSAEEAAVELDADIAAVLVADGIDEPLAASPLRATRALTTWLRSIRSRLRSWVIFSWEKATIIWPALTFSQ